MRKAQRAIKPITFRVYADSRRRGLYVAVNVWPNKRAMYAHKPLERNHEASCTGLKVIRIPPNGAQRTLPLFAEVNFHRGYIGTGCVAHEFTHALFCWAERVKLNLSEITAKAGSYKRRSKSRSLNADSVEERCCYVLGDMVRQFVLRAHKLGLYGVGLNVYDNK